MENSYLGTRQAYFEVTEGQTASREKSIINPLIPAFLLNNIVIFNPRLKRHSLQSLKKTPLMPFEEINDIYSENHMKRLNMLCGS
jgi:hypothetical protein